MENKWGMHMKTSISEKIAYGMGDVACNVVYALTSGLIVYFYTNVIGVWSCRFNGDCEKKSVNKILL